MIFSTTWETFLILEESSEISYMNLDLHVKYLLFLSEFKQQQPSSENLTQLSH